jgi:RpiB/LacA/LacB family sugar-phosphate isomerase
MRIGIASDHAGFSLKQPIAEALQKAGHEIVDFGATEYVAGDDYPDFVIPLAKGVAAGVVERGVAVCGSGVGANVAANKVHGARAALIMDPFSAHQGVEDDDMNVICLGARIIGFSLAWELVQAFLAARFSGAERHARRLAKVIAAERTGG